MEPKSARSPRTSPRGSRADGEATRERLIEAAGRQFARSGYAEATSKAIAVEAGADLASINYHFGSRSGLYQAVLIEAHNRLIDVGELRRLVASTLPGPEKLKGVITQLVKAARTGPEGWHLRVLAREILAPSSHIDVLYQDALLPKLAVIRQIVSQASGVAVEDPALARCMLSIAAPCLMLVLGSTSAPGPIRDVLAQPDALIIEHLHGFAMGGLQKVRQFTVTRLRDS